MRWIVLIILTACNLNPSIFNNKGNIDTVGPSCVIETTIPDPVLTDSVLCYTTFSKGPITGFTSGDVTLTNCTLTEFTQISHNRWSFVLNPTIDGTFTAVINAGACSWTSNAGTSVANLVSNTLSKTYDSGATYDLENAASITKIRTRVGNVAAFTHNNDLLSVTSVPGMELLHTKYNFPVTQFANGNNIANQNMYDFGVCDFGVISISDADFDTREPLISVVRDNNSPAVGSYKNGDDSYSAELTNKVFAHRNSAYDGPKTGSPTYAYTGWPTAEQALSWGSSFRHDYSQKVTTTSYYSGLTQEQGDALLATYVAYVIANNGCYSDFVHHHWQVGNYPKHYLSKLTTEIAASTVHRGTANEVRALGRMYDVVTDVSGSGNTITVTHPSYSIPSPFRKQLPFFGVRVDLTGTVFDGEDIALSNGLRPHHVSGNIFHIPIALDFSGTTSTVSLGIATGGPNYVNLTQPVPSRTGSSVTCDQEVKYTIWRVAKPTALASSVTSASIPTADNTTVNLTVATGLTIPAGTQVRVLADGSNYFYASVTSYTSGTGALVLSSFPDAVGSGSHSSWTITRYYHELAATEVERSFEYSTSYTILATLDEVNYTYHVGVINRDGISNAIP